jgi:hypothetical protein
MSDKATGCAKPTGFVVGETATNGKESPAKGLGSSIVEVPVTAKVGAKAPDFEAPTYYQGEFSQVKLSDYLGKWVLLCFYPGDFTFV